MARNGSGTYSKINTFVAGNSITAAGHNQNWDDAVTEITNSVAADGQTTITGQMRGSTSGSVSAPAYSFSGDLNTGIYRIGADNLGITVGGTKILDIATTGVTLTVDAAFVSSTPTPTPGSGTFTSATLTCHTKSIGKTVHMWGELAVTTVGTASGNVTFTLPVTATAAGAIGGLWNRSDGSVLTACWLSATTTCVLVFGVTAIGNKAYNFSITYEAA